jgi:hypothetical protein
MSRNIDVRQIDLLGGAIRQRGRPATGKAMSAAERQKARRDRLRASGVGSLTVELPVDVLDGLNKFLQFRDETQDQLIERLLRQQLLRKR